MNQPSKPIWMSMTFWGSILTVVTSLLVMNGVNLNPTDIADLNAIVKTLLLAVTSGITVYGRVRANSKATFTVRKVPDPIPPEETVSD